MSNENNLLNTRQLFLLIGKNMSSEDKKLIDLARELDARDAAARQIAAEIMRARLGIKEKKTFFGKVWGGIKGGGKYVVCTAVPAALASAAGTMAAMYVKENYLDGDDDNDGEE